MIAKYVNKQVIENLLYNDLQYIDNDIIIYSFSNVFDVNVTNEELNEFAINKILYIDDSIVLEEIIVDY